MPGSTQKFSGDKKQFLEHLRKALYASKLISYAQGFMLLREAAKVSLFFIFTIISEALGEQDLTRLFIYCLTVKVNMEERIQTKTKLFLMMIRLFNT